MRKSSINGVHVIGVPVTAKAFGIEEEVSLARGQSFRKADGDHLAVSLSHPSPYTSFGYKHSSKGQVIHWVSKLSRRAQGFREHVTLGPKLSETVKGKLSLGAKNPAGRRDRARVPEGVLGGERRAAGEGAAVLPVHHRRAHRRDALRLHQEGRLPQRPAGHGHLGQGRRRAGALQGGGPAQEDRPGAAERECRQAGGEVHPRRHGGRLRVLVHGVRELPEVVQVHAASHLGAAMTSARACWWSGGDREVHYCLFRRHDEKRSYGLLRRLLLRGSPG
ncbi:hypothetical protein EE612_024530 [Oryza sativa]|nr:hypothetical protein EE612_024530 [Oryza sativa]